jgi:hypothetical protein
MNPINLALVSNGWKIWPNPFGEKQTTFLAKSFEGHAKCRCNETKNKQIEIYHHHPQTISGHHLYATWSIECNGELPDGEWLRIKVGGLTDLKTIEEMVERLLFIWDHAVSITPKIPKHDR